MDAQEQPHEIQTGTAGASARREHERRKANGEQRTRDKHPHIGRLLLTLREDPVHVQVWARSADAELPMLGKLTLNGYPLLYAKALAKRINAPGPIATADIPTIARQLAGAFPAA